MLNTATSIPAGTLGDFIASCRPAMPRDFRAQRQRDKDLEAFIKANRFTSTASGTRLRSAKELHAVAKKQQLPVRAIDIERLAARKGWLLGTWSDYFDE